MAYTKDIGLKDFYNYYKETAIRKNRIYVDYKTFTNIIKDFNTEIKNKIVYEAERIDLPYKLGKLSVKKFTNTYTETNKKNWRVNYKASKEKGYIVYHASEYGYRWKWNKFYCKVSSRKWYSFKPCRTASRAIADAIKNKNIDYYES